MASRMINMRSMNRENHELKTKNSHRSGSSKNMDGWSKLEAVS